MKKYLVILLAAMFATSAFAQNEATEKIKWMSFEEALALAEKKPRRIFVDLYTDWCGWCKQMDKTTFSDPVIAKMMNEHFYAVKFNAEGRDTITYAGNTYVNPNPGAPRSTHQLAVTLLQGKLGYPSFVFLGDKQEIMTKVMGYRNATEFEVILSYYSGNAYKKTAFEQYKLEYKPSPR